MTNPLKLTRVKGSMKKLAKGQDTGLHLLALWWGIIAAISFWLFSSIIILFFTLFMGSGIYDTSVFFYLMGVISIIIGGITSGFKSQNKGMIHGLWVGLLLGLISIIGLIELVPSSITLLTALKQLGQWCIWGSLGGLIGVKLKPKQPISIADVRKSLSRN